MERSFDSSRLLEVRALALAGRDAPAKMES